MKIVTSHQRPPIPTSKWDWCAFFDGFEEEGCYGFGSTELEAVNDLLASHPEHVEHVLNITAPEVAA